MRHSLILLARRWRDRNGNTYHTVQVIVDGVPLYKSGITYGYDHYYEITAKNWLAARGLVPEDCVLWRHVKDELGLLYYTDVVNVARKADL